MLRQRSSVEYKECEIIALPRKYEAKPYGFAFQTNSPYLQLFNYYINRLRENGILERASKAFEPEPQECPDIRGKALGFENCSGAFLVMMIGFGIAILTLGIETAIKKCN